MMNNEVIKIEIRKHIKRWTKVHALIFVCFLLFGTLISLFITFLVSDYLDITKDIYSSEIEGVIYSQNEPSLKEYSMYRFNGLSSIKDKNGYRESVVVYMMLENEKPHDYCDLCNIDNNHVILSKSFLGKIRSEEKLIYLNDFAFMDEQSLEIHSFSILNYELGREARPFIIVPYNELLLNNNRYEYISIYTNSITFNEAINLNELIRAEPYLLKEYGYSFIFIISFFAFLNFIQSILIVTSSLKLYHSKLDNEIRIFQNDGFEKIDLKKILKANYKYVIEINQFIFLLLIMLALLLKQSLYIHIIFVLIVELLLFHSFRKRIQI